MWREGDELAQPSRFLLNRVISIPISTLASTPNAAAIRTTALVENLEKDISAVTSASPTGDSSSGELKNELQDTLRTKTTQLARTATLDTVLGCMGMANYARSTQLVVWHTQTHTSYSPYEPAQRSEAGQ